MFLRLSSCACASLLHPPTNPFHACMRACLLACLQMSDAYSKRLHASAVALETSEQRVAELDAVVKQKDEEIEAKGAEMQVRSRRREGEEEGV